LLLENNAWSTYKIQKSFMANQVGNLVVYKDLLLATALNENGLKLGIFDLNSITNFYLNETLYLDP